MVLLRAQPADDVLQDHPQTRPAGAVGTAAMPEAAEVEHGRARRHGRRQDLVFRDRLPPGFPAVAAGHQPGRAVVPGELIKRPHRVDHNRRMRLGERVDRVVPVQHLGLLPRADTNADRSAELIVAEYQVEHIEQQRMDGNLVERPGLGEQGIDPLGVETLEMVTALRRRLQDPAQVRPGGGDVALAHQPGDDHVAVAGQPLHDVLAGARRAWQGGQRPGPRPAVPAGTYRVRGVAARAGGDSAVLSACRWSRRVPVQSRRYGPDVLAAGKPRRRELRRIAAERGLVVEDAAGQFCGAVVGCEKDAVILEDRHGRRRVFPLSPAAFLLEGEAVMLVRPAGPEAAGVGQARTASGSIAAPPSRAKVARESRIYVEGRHDAELVEKIWGDDLRDVGVVVEYLGGIDELPAIVAGFCPGPGRRLGVLVDHLVAGSKESRIAASVQSPDVLVAGHPYVDVWAAVKPAVLGIDAWPAIPPGTPWKEGVLRALGWPPDTAAAWRRILRSVTSFADLEPAFLGRVEELIDFVATPGSH